MASWRSKEPDPEDLGRSLERLAALVRAGIPVDRARGHLDDDPLAAGFGSMPVEARAARAALQVAQRAGAGMAGAIESTAAAARERAALRRTLQTAMAGPVSTARMVVLLPLLGPLLAFALGMNPIEALTSGPLGPAAVLIGALLMIAAWLWSRRIITAGSITDGAAGLELELLGIALGGGMSLEAARALVADALSAAELEPAPEAVVDEITTLAQRAGVPVRGLLESEARARRHAAGQEAERRAAKAAVALTIPLGVCVLPAFVLLGVVPFVLTTLQSLQLPL